VQWAEELRATPRADVVDEAEGDDGTMEVE